MDHKEFLIETGKSAREALRIIDEIGKPETTLFITHDNEVVGSLTDGDIRRGLLKGHSIDDKVELYKNPTFNYFEEGYTKQDISRLRERDLRFVPLLDNNRTVIDIIDIFHIKSNLPLDAIIMAGGEGRRLRPLTDNLPKPLIKVGDKPIIEHNIDRLKKFGIRNINITLMYEGQQIIDYFGNGESKGIQIKYVTEESPMGTMGALSLVENYHNDYVLVMNSDLLTDINFDEFFESFLNENADMAVASTTYRVNVPYAVLELNGENEVLDFKEKPKYTYYSNAGIYIMKKELLDWIPRNERFDATDMIRMVLEKKKKLITEPILGYWLDIGKMEDLAKAQSDIKHLRL